MLQREISEKKFQMDSLDGLRGFAALLVVLSHTSRRDMLFIPFLDLSGIGKSGVFLFFLLSSFLLTLSLLRKGRKIFTYPCISHYWQRRFFRIYPLYTLYLLLAVVSSWVVTIFIGENGIPIPFYLNLKGFIGHIFLLRGRGVTWSIAVEFKLYFILPILALLITYIRSYGHKATYTTFCILMIASQIISPQSESLVNDTRLLPYMPVFITGIFLAVIHEQINANKPSKKVKNTLKWLGLFGIVGIILMTPLVFSLLIQSVPQSYFHKQFILYSLLWSFIILSAVNVNGMVQTIFTFKLLRFYGAISFGLYLFHPIFIDVLNIAEINGYLSAWLVLFASTITAYMSFQFLEGPISKYKININSPTTIVNKIKRFTQTK